MSSFAGACTKRKRKTKVFGFHSFAHPGVPIDFSGAFRDNIHSFLEECADLENYCVEGFPTWSTWLVDESTGFVIPLYVVEEKVMHSSRPYCDYCRCIGWSHHFVSRRRYHVIIPVDSEWDKPLEGEIFDLENHLFHGLIHCNGFGHLLCINGHEGGSKHIGGIEIMDLWDRICTKLRLWKVSVVDLSRKKSMDLRLLHGVAYGHSWFGRWGYKFLHGCYGVTELKYHKAIDILSSLELDRVIEDFSTIGRETEMTQFIHMYRSLSETPLRTIQDLLRFMLDLGSRLPLQSRSTKSTATPVIPSSPPAGPTKQRKPMGIDKKQQYRDFSDVAQELNSRWSARRLELAAQVIVDALKDEKERGGGGMPRQEVRDVARLQIGDTGLLDFVLKSLGNCKVENYVVHRTVNPSTRVLEFALEDVKAIVIDPVKEPAPKVLGPTKKAEVYRDMVAVGPTKKADVYRDVIYVYKNLLKDYPLDSMEQVPLAARVILDGKNFVKDWPFNDDEDVMLRFLCRVMPSVGREVEELSRPLPPPDLLVVPPHATVGELKLAGERAMRDTYCIMEEFIAQEIDGVDGEDNDLLFGLVESGTYIWLRGDGLDLKSKYRYEGGMDKWTVDCTCGARDDDGERMVACDVCEVWQHTRCAGIDDGDNVPQLFLCARCGSMFLPPGLDFGMMKLRAEEYP